MVENKFNRVYGEFKGLDSRDDALRNIEEINLLYLKGLRDLALCDPAQAGALYGVTEHAAAEIAQATMESIQALAAGCIAVFRLECKNANFADSDPKSRMAQLARVIK